MAIWQTHTTRRPWISYQTTLPWNAAISCLQFCQELQLIPHHLARESLLCRMIGEPHSWFQHVSPWRIAKYPWFRHPVITVTINRRKPPHAHYISLYISVCFLVSKFSNGHQKHGTHGFKIVYCNSTEETLLGGSLVTLELSDRSCRSPRGVANSQMQNRRTARSVLLIEI